MTATALKWREKDLYLTALFERRLPLCFRFERREYTMTVINRSGDRLFLLPDRPVRNLRRGCRMEMLFRYDGELIQFTADVAEVITNLVIAARSPDFLLKDLGRSFARVRTPEDLRASFMFQEERYALGFPRVSLYEPVQAPRQFMADRGIGDPRAPVRALYAWAAGVADGYKAVVFTRAKPGRLEERMVAETGKTLYIASPEAGLPREDFGSPPQLITDSLFLRVLDRMGFEGGEAAGVRDALLRGKEKEGIWSEVWAPIRFQEYVLGYVRLWTVRDGSPSLDDKAVEMVMAFTQFIAYALKEAGYFEGRRKANKPFVGTVIDMSASGLLFTYPVSYTGLALRPGAELGVTLETPRRIIRGGVRIVRRFLSLSGPVLKLGAAFRDLEGEDLRGLFEYLYEKPFTAGRMSFLAGRV